MKFAAALTLLATSASAFNVYNKKAASTPVSNDSTGRITQRGLLTHFDKPILTLHALSCMVIGVYH